MNKKILSALSDQELEEKKIKQDKALEETRKEYLKIQKKLNAMHKDYEKIVKDYEKIVKEINRRRLVANKAAGIVDIAWYLQEINENGYEDSDMDLYHEKEAYFNGIGLRTSGYFSDTGQSYVQICLYNKEPDSIQQTLDALKIVLPFIKPIDGAILIGIFESTLSAHGIYQLEISPDNNTENIMLSKCNLTKTFYGRKTIEEKFPNIQKAIEYIAEYHFYHYYRDYEKDEKYRRKIGGTSADDDF